MNQHFSKKCEEIFKQTFNSIVQSYKKLHDASKVRIQSQEPHLIETNFLLEELNAAAFSLEQIRVLQRHPQSCTNIPFEAFSQCHQLIESAQIFLKEKLVLQVEFSQFLDFEQRLLSKAANHLSSTLNDIFRDAYDIFNECYFENLIDSAMKLPPLLLDTRLLFSQCLSDPSLILIIPDSPYFPESITLLDIISSSSSTLTLSDPRGLFIYSPQNHSERYVQYVQRDKMLMIDVHQDCTLVIYEIGGKGELTRREIIESDLCRGQFGMCGDQWLSYKIGGQEANGGANNMITILNHQSLKMNQLADKRGQVASLQHPRQNPFCKVCRDKLIIAGGISQKVFDFSIEIICLKECIHLQLIKLPEILNPSSCLGALYFNTQANELLFLLSSEPTHTSSRRLNPLYGASTSSSIWTYYTLKLAQHPEPAIFTCLPPDSFKPSQPLPFLIENLTYPEMTEWWDISVDGDSVKIILLNFTECGLQNVEPVRNGNSILEFA